MGRRPSSLEQFPVPAALGSGCVAVQVVRGALLVAQTGLGHEVDLCGKLKCVAGATVRRQNEHALRHNTTELPSDGEGGGDCAELLEGFDAEHPRCRKQTTLAAPEQQWWPWVRTPAPVLATGNALD